MASVDDMPADLMPAKLEEYANATLYVTFGQQIASAQNDTMQSTNASTHKAVLRALDQYGIPAHLPIARIVAKVRTSSSVDDPALGQLCAEWEKYRQQLFAANSSVLRAVTTTVQSDAYDQVLGQLTFDNCFTNQLWVSKRIDLREDQFPTMNGDNIDQFIDGLERSSMDMTRSLNWQSQAPHLWQEIEDRVAQSFAKCRKRALITRFQNYVSQFWQPTYKTLTTSCDSRIRTIEQMATGACLPGLGAHQSLQGLIDTFKDKWVRMFNKGQCTFAQVQQFIDTETKEVAQLKAANEASLKQTDYGKMQHDYTCAFAVHEWLVMTRDLAVQCRQAMEDNERMHSDVPQIVRALGLAPPAVASSNNVQAESKRSSSSSAAQGEAKAAAEKAFLPRDVVAQCQHQELALIARINTAQKNLAIINELTEVRRQAFQMAVLLDYASFVWQTIQLLQTHQGDYRESLGAMEAAGQPPVGGGGDGSESKGEVKGDAKGQDSDRVYLDEYQRYIGELAQILGLDSAGNRRSHGNLAGAVVESESIDTLQMHETLQTNTSHKLLEPHRRNACQQMQDVLRSLDGLVQTVSDVQRSVTATGLTAVVGLGSSSDLKESGTQVKGWTNWNIEAKLLHNMPDTAQKLLHYVDHVRRIYAHAFGGMQPQLLHLEQLSMQAASNAAAALGLSFKRVKVMAQPKQTTAIGNMLHNQQKVNNGAKDGDNKDDWISMTAVQAPQKGSMSVATFLTTLHEWVEIATVCSLFKESNADNARLQYAFKANAGSSSSKRKLPVDFGF